MAHTLMIVQNEGNYKLTLEINKDLDKHAEKVVDAFLDFFKDFKEEELDINAREEN